MEKPDSGLMQEGSRGSPDIPFRAIRSSSFPTKVSHGPVTPADRFYRLYEEKCSDEEVVSPGLSLEKRSHSLDQFNFNIPYV